MVLHYHDFQEVAKYVEDSHHVVSRELLDIALNHGLEKYLFEVDLDIRSHEWFEWFDSDEIEISDKSFIIFLDDEGNSLDENISLEDVLDYTLSNGERTAKYTPNGRWGLAVTYYWTSLSRFGLITIWEENNKIYIYL